MKNDENLEEVLSKIKNLDNGINTMIVPMLKDSISDYKKIINKLIIVIVMLICGLVGVGIYSQILLDKQNEKYSEFLSQFEFESEEIYQDIDAGDGSNSTINDGIQFTK